MSQQVLDALIYAVTKSAERVRELSEQVSDPGTPDARKKPLTKSLVDECDSLSSLCTRLSVFELPDAPEPEEGDVRRLDVYMVKLLLMLTEQRQHQPLCECCRGLLPPEPFESVWNQPPEHDPRDLYLKARAASKAQADDFEGITPEAAKAHRNIEN